MKAQIFVGSHNLYYIFPQSLCLSPDFSGSCEFFGIGFFSLGRKRNPETFVFSSINWTSPRNVSVDHIYILLLEAYKIIYKKLNHKLIPKDALFPDQCPNNLAKSLSTKTLIKSIYFSQSSPTNPHIRYTFDSLLFESRSKKSIPI